ncbi:hypothetical protein N4T20_14960 [Flavobacterium sp. TR2]|uniref:hypothetical protein n=1 Tax=Flavobacterium sp. TR2 TaxID=2977321 RepID=UPI0021B139E3|nr:hypothetical protein [Flavobacterium sp. TR2]UWY27021.1 hypothetical protein N4T20_14960 [Flavobacterium sp. TR2]
MKAAPYIIAFSSLILIQCSSSRITSSYVSPKKVNLEKEKIIVAALAKESDYELQKKMENHLADDLCNLGYNAMCSTDLFDLSASNITDEKLILKKLQQAGADAVLTIVLLSRDKEKYHVPATMYGIADQYSYNRFYPYYAAIYSKIYDEGYYINDTSYFWESNLYSVPDQNLVYSVRTESFNPLSISSLAHQYGRLIIQDMFAKKVIKNLKK